MKPTEQEISDFARQEANRSVFKSNFPHHQPSVEFGAKQGVKWAISQMQPEWVEINSIKDLPTEPCKAFFFDKPTQTVKCGSFRPTKEEINFILANASHYMIIEEPQPPIK